MEQMITIQQKDFDLAKFALRLTVGEIDHLRIHDPEVHGGEVHDFRFKFSEALYGENQAAELSAELLFLLDLAKRRQFSEVEPRVPFDATKAASDAYSKALDRKTELIRQDLARVEDAIAREQDALSLPLSLSSFDLPEYLRAAATSLIIDDERSRALAERFKGLARDLEKQRADAVKG